MLLLLCLCRGKLEHIELWRGGGYVWRQERSRDLNNAFKERLHYNRELGRFYERLLIVWIVDLIEAGNACVCYFFGNVLFLASIYICVALWNFSFCIFNVNHASLLKQVACLIWMQDCKRAEFDANPKALLSADMWWSSTSSQTTNKTMHNTMIIYMNVAMIIIMSIIMNIRGCSKMT